MAYADVVERAKRIDWNRFGYAYDYGEEVCILFIFFHLLIKISRFLHFFSTVGHFSFIFFDGHISFLLHQTHFLYYFPSE